MLLAAIHAAIALAAVAQEPTDMTVRVVDGRTGAPLSGASVQWTDHQEELEAALPEGMHLLDSSCEDPTVPERAVDLWGRGDLTSDDHGLVHMVGVQRGAIAVGRMGDLWGWGFFSASWRGDRELTLFPDEAITVRVLHPSGDPAGNVPVTLERTYFPESRGSRTKVLVVTSDASGLAVFGHARSLMSRVATEGGACWFVALDLCGYERPERELRLDDWPAGAVDIVLPVCGSVEVVLRDALGRPVTPEQPVVLARFTSRVWADGKPWVSGSALWRSGTRLFGVTSMKADTGRVVYEYVPVGHELVAIARRNLGSVAGVARLRGPTRAGERVSVELRLGAGLTVRGRVRLPGGAPLASRFVVVEVHDADVSPKPLPEGSDRWIGSRVYSRPSQAGLVRTNAAGCFTVDLDLDPAGRVLRRPVLVLDVRRNTPSMLGASIEFDALMERAPDLGDLWLEVPPVLVAGRVVDRTGRPVRGARIVTREGSPPFSATSQDDGTFVIRTFTPRPPLKLSAHRDGYESAYRSEVPAGSQDVELLMGAARR